MVLSETRGLWLSWIVREGIGWSRRLACLKHGPDVYGGYLPSNPRVSRTRQLPPGIGPRWNGLFCQRRSSCLLFQIVGFETYLLLPDDQRDRGNLPRQGQARHRGLPSLSQQSLVEIAQRSSIGAGSHRPTLENIFEVVVVIVIETSQGDAFLRTLSLSLHAPLLPPSLGL